MKIAAFDFDHTIIDVNSDTYIDKLLVKGSDSKRYKYPDEVEELYEKHNWTYRMNGVFDFMRKNHSIRKNDIINCLNEIKISEPMKDVIKRLSQAGYKLAVISDANTVFIEAILNQNNIYEHFDKIYTNPAEFDENERLNVKPFSQIFNKNGEPFDCVTKICSTNICKGDVLNSYMDELREQNNHNDVNHLIYVGDGHNDYCPGLRLRENDLYFVRENHSLSRLLKKDDVLAKKIKGQIKYWSDAVDILNQL